MEARRLKRFRNLFQGGLRTRILGWIFIPTMIILAAVALINFYAYQQATTEQVLARDQELTRLSAAQLGTEIKTYANLLDSLTRLAAFQENDLGAVQAALNEARNRLVVFDGGVVVLDNFGVVRAAVREQPIQVGRGLVRPGFLPPDCTGDPACFFKRPAS